MGSERRQKFAIGLVTFVLGEGYGDAHAEARFYALTRAGEKQLTVEKETWDRLAAAVRLIFNEGR